MAVAVLAIAITVPAVAMGDEATGETGDMPETAFSEIQAAPAVTDPSVAAELPHTDLDREDVLALVGGVFENALEGAAGPFDDLVVERFLSDHAAVVDGEQSPEPTGLVVGETAENSGGKLLLESTVPLRHEGEVLDLGVERVAGVVESTNPLVDVEIPEALGDGIELPEYEVQVSLPDAEPGRAPSILDGSTALYPNIAPNTDFIVAPTPTGFETFTVLRDPEAAVKEQEIRVDVPAGATQMENPDGSITFSQDDEKLLHISAPAAIDAAGQAVPASMRVDQSSIYLSVDPDSETTWPVLLDPMFETYQMEGSGIWVCDEFDLTSWPLEYPSHYMAACTTRMGSWTQRGLGIRGTAGTYWPSWKKWSHSVPRLKQDELAGTRPTSFISAMNLSNVYVITSGGPASPYALAGIRDTALDDWSGVAPYKAVWGYPGNGVPISNATVTFTSGGSHEAKMGVVSSLAVNEASPTSTESREMFVGGVTFEVGDTDLPQVLFPYEAGNWINSLAKDPITATIRDPGLGAKRATFKIPGQDNATVDHPCVGVVASPCPRTFVATLAPNQYNPALMPQGETPIDITGEDVLGQKSPAAKAWVLVDHTAPSLSLGGNLTEQGTVGTNLSSYTLNYGASDGDDAAASSQPPIGSQGTGAGQFERPQGVAVDADGNVWVTDRINQRVVAYDKNGNYLRQISAQGSGDGQIKEPRGIAIGPNGNIWVAEAANKRIQQFTPSGTFVSKVTNVAFVEPWGVAFGPGGEMWVTDQAAKKVFLFNSYGTLVKTVSFNYIPNGIDIDRFGNAWIASQGTHHVIELSPTGSVIQRFGTEGTGPGQFRHPIDIAVAASGNILVSDDLNDRIQVFKPDGSFLRQFGTSGSGNAQFEEPRGIDVGPGNTAVIADAGNRRVARWAHADQDPQSGVAKVEVKIDGVTAHTKAPGCTTKNCSVTGSWTLDADDYSSGAHKVEVVATDAVGIEKTKTLDIETHGDGTNPTIALSGTMTQQASIGTTRPIYKLKVVATDPGPTAERKSGVAATTIKVDGTVVDMISPGCPAGGCSITREWTLNSDSYSVGPHTVEVKATDEAGRSAVKTLEINIARDTTAPEFASLGDLYTAPSGWVEQKSYDYGSMVTDTNGYGVTSVQLEIDGQVVNSLSQSCPAGNCMRFFAPGEYLDMRGYEGGAHPAELVATDGAGNMRKRTWTIKVSPSGEILPAEAADTLEAMEETVPSEEWFLPVASTPEYLEPEIIEAGANPHFKEEGENVVSTGVTVKTTIDPESETVSIEGPEGKLELIPQVPTQEAEIVEGAAAVLPANNIGADTVIRPEYNGSHMFTTIREASAPESYEWHLKLNPGQYLFQANPEQIEVRRSSGETSFLITAEPAHDATGKHVPTTLSILGGSDIALNIPHRNQGFTYPVAAGKSYETGYAEVNVYIPEEEAPAGEEPEEPLTPQEQQELDEDVYFMNAFKGTKQTRDRNKPFSKKQAKRVARIKKTGRTVAAPSASASGSPGYPSQPKKRVFELSGRTCSSLNCDIWQIELNEGTFTRGPDWVVPTPYMYEDNWNCDHHVDDWYTWNMDIDLGEDGIRGSYVEKGEGEHLTFWCDFNVMVYPIPEELALDGDQALEIWVFANGYQASHGVWKEPFSFIPFDLPWQ